jgi:hypothetical protein
MDGSVGNDGGMAGMNDGSDSGFGATSGDAFGGIGFGDTSGLASVFGDVGMFSDPANNASWGFDSNPFGMDSFTDNSLALSFQDNALEGLLGQPVTALGNPDSFMSTLQDLTKSKTLNAFLGFLAARGNPVAAALVSAPAKAAQSNNPASSIANSAASWGLSTLGPIGALAAFVGNATGAFNGITGQLGNTNAPSSFQGNQGNMGDALPGLAGLYAGYQGMRDTNKMLGGLQGLYAQDSPYAQAMRQQLARRDAAGGRRSQYGPREVELQAKLAQMASSQIPAMTALQRQQTMSRNAMLQQGLGAYRQMGGLSGIRDALGLSGIFSSLGGMSPSSVWGLENMFPNLGIPDIPMPSFDFGPPPGI